MRYDDFDDDESEEDNEHVFTRLRHENGTIVTFLMAPASLFTEQMELQPLVFGICEGSVCVALNEDLIQRLLTVQVEENGDIYDARASALLQATLILKEGCKAASNYIREQTE